jgi:hypothetical protein
VFEQDAVVVEQDAVVVVRATFKYL